MNPLLTQTTDAIAGEGCKINVSDGLRDTMHATDRAIEELAERALATHTKLNSARIAMQRVLIALRAVKTGYLPAYGKDIESLRSAKLILEEELLKP
jgi:hypothetical protein